MSPVERFLDVGSIRMRAVELGSGPAVVMCHGFPGLAYSWRHQMPALARAGFRAIAVDMRGYGGTDRPEDPAAYDRTSTVGDLTGLLDALGLDDAVFVGHDFGAGLVWDLPQWAPGRVRGLIQLSVPRAATSPILPSAGFASLARDHFFHMHYFQQPGVADAELDADPPGFLQRVFWALSGGYRYTDIFAHPSAGNGYLDVLPHAPALPWSWLSEAELGHYVETFTSTGFTGGLNWYRAADHIWREKQERPDEPITLPVCFLTGDRDPVQQITGRGSIDAMRESVPGLRETHVLPGVGHFLQMEAAADVNRIMVDFLRGL